MNRTLVLVVVMGLAGLVVGYLVFARIGSGYVKVADLVEQPQGGMTGFLQKARAALSGVDIPRIRRNILICGGIGAAIGLVASLVGKRPRR